MKPSITKRSKLSLMRFGRELTLRRATRRDSLHAPRALVRSAARFRSSILLRMRQLMPSRRLAVGVVAGLLLLANLASGVASPAQQTTASDPFAIPATDDGLPGAGPIRRYDWFQKLWRERRSRVGHGARAGQGAVVFLGDSITQGWGGGLGAAFPGVKVANRGISGDTTRGVLIRLQEDVLALDPAAVVLLIGTNDLEEGATPARCIAGNLQADPRRPREARSRQMPIVLCQVFPSSASKKRPADTDQGDERPLPRRGEERPAGHADRDLAALRRRRAATRRSASFPTCCIRTRPATPSGRRRCARCSRRSGLTETTRRSVHAGGRASRACSTAATSRAGAIGRRRRRTRRAPRRWQAADPNAAAWPFVTEAVALRRPDGDARRALRADRRPARGDDAARVPQDPAALDDARVPRGLRAQARVPRHAQRRQRRLPARPAAAVPRLRAGRPLQGPRSTTSRRTGTSSSSR